MKISFILGLALLTTSLQAQDKRFFIPKEIHDAYANDTRSMDGKPGPEYWQNEVDYTIEVAFDPVTRQLTGSEKVTYYNNSPDNLNTLVIRVYNDVFRKANPRAQRVNPEDIGDGVTIRSIIVDGVDFNINNPREVQRSGTNVFVNLNEPLRSGESVTVDVDWSQLVTITNDRTGTYDSSSFFIAYFYPQMAVYDDVFGWDDMDYSLRTEFYNNLANFDVKITVPESFNIWATGLLQNASDVLPETQYQRYAKALGGAEETVKIITAEDLSGDYKNKSTTWHFSAQEVTDFAFATSDHYLWDAASQQVADRKVLIESIYPIDQAAEFVDHAQMQRKIMRHFSEDMPGVPYPYEAFSTFIGLFGGGMEFPMMANNDGPNLGLTIHEMFHTYFPMYVRVNERRFAFMDEGWAAYFDEMLENRFWEGDDDFILNSNYKLQIDGTIGSISDLPLITSSQFMDDSNYGYASYPLPAFFYSILHHYLGDDRFLAAFQEYVRRWAKKAPTPYDFIYTFEDVVGEDLSWLWKPWFFEYGSTDVDILRIEDDQLVVKNQGTRPVPLQVELTYQDGSVKMIEENASIWRDNDVYNVELADADRITNIIVNGGLSDMTTLSNYYPPISERYKDFDLPEGIEGSYMVLGFNVELLVSMKNDVYQLIIPEASFETYLTPESNVRMVSLDGESVIYFDLNKAGEVTGATVEAFGYKLPAQKK